MKNKSTKKWNNKGAALGEALCAFLIVCIGVVMLMSCIVLACNIISQSKSYNDKVQTEINTFWSATSPTSTETETVTLKDQKGKTLGSFDIVVNAYQVSEEDTFFEYSTSTESD